MLQISAAPILLRTLSVLATLAIALPAYAHTAEPLAETSTPAATLAPVEVSERGGAQKPSERSDSYTVRKLKGPTGLALSQKETPQSVSVLTRAKLDDFHVTSVNDALDGVTGMTVERVETDRTYYTARGFDITNFQTDGIGLPMAFGLVEGDMDTALYDRIEVVRGANGLMSATGNPSATINLLRRRPTKDFQASASLSFGSWDSKRQVGDVSGALVESGKLRARLIVGGEDGDSYLDRYHKRKSFMSATVEADVAEATTLTAGYSYQNNRPTGVMWGALPLVYTDGSATHYARSTSTAADWSYWNVKNQTAFTEARHVFDSGWQASATLTRRENRQDSNLFYVYGTPDRATGLGLYSYPSAYQMKSAQNQLDVRASGPFRLFGREHEAIFGASYARSTMWEFSGYGNDVGTAFPALEAWNGDYPRSAFDASSNGADFRDRQRSVFAAAKLQATERMKLILGANNTRYTTMGQSYGENHARADSATSPYAGITYDLTPTLAAYSGYTTIFSPQYQLDGNLRRLDPATGHSVEAGLKYEAADGGLNASAALFQARQDNLAESAGYVGATAVYKGVDTLSKGIELEASGRVAPGVQLSSGYTALTISRVGGGNTRPYAPRHMFNVAAKWQALESLKLGAKLRWQGDTHVDVDSGLVARQEAYAILDLMAGYAFTKKLSLDLNLNNVTDKKYLTSLYWTQGYYGAGINGSLSLNWKY